MKKAILATKVGMTQIFNEDGVLTPVTVLQAGPCVVTQVKTEDNDGYKAVQVGFVDKREKLINKPLKGHFDKAGVSYKRYVREFRFENAEEYVRSRNTDSTEVPWLMVLNSIVIRVLTELVPIRPKFSKEKECPVIWVTNRSLFRTLRSLKLT